jgi:hypothetical protein
MTGISKDDDEEEDDDDDDDDATFIQYTYRTLLIACICTYYICSSVEISRVL